MDEDARPTGQDVAARVGDLGWRLVWSVLHTEVRVPSLARAAEAATLAVAAAGAQGADHLRADIRADRAVLQLAAPHLGVATERDVRLAGEVSAALTAQGLSTTPGESLQVLEIAIDALDIAAVRPFWTAVTGYVDEPGFDDPNRGLFDPTGRGPAIWFQQMDAPRPQRNRIHVDVSVPHDAATARIDAAVAAGGTLRSDDAAPAFWVLADPEGNEACICTWQGRD